MDFMNSVTPFSKSFNLKVVVDLLNSQKNK